MSKYFKNYKNVEKEGNMDMKLNIKVDKRELEETLDLLKEIKEEMVEIEELMKDIGCNSYLEEDPFAEWKEQLNIKDSDKIKVKMYIEE